MNDVNIYTKVAVVMPGYHQLPYEFCKFLSMENYKVSLILPKRRNEKEIEGNGFKVIYLKSISLLFDLPIMPTLYFYLKKENFDIVVSGEDFQPATFVAAFYANKYNKPFFPIIEKYFLSRFFFPRQFHKVQLKIVAPIIWNKSKKVISHSTAAKKFLIANGIPKEKVTCITVGTDTNHFKHISPHKTSDCVNILSVARLIPHKGLFDLLNAIKIIKDKGLNFKLTIVGDGPLYRQILEKIKIDELQDWTEIICKIPYSKMPEIYNKCDIFVLNSVVEVLGISVIEAMACGKPVIVTNVGGLPDFVNDGKNGYIVNPKDPKGLAEKLEILISANGFRQRMGKQSLMLVEKNFDWKVVTKKYARLFNE